MSYYIKSLADPIVIAGMGLSGESAKKLLLTVGIVPASILTFDQKLSADLKDPNEVVKLRPKTLVVSPGVSLDAPWIQKILNDGAQLTSELALASSLLTTEIVVGITGSLGKSTTTCLLGEIFKSTDPQAFVGGNLGFPLADYAREILLGRPRAKFIALELSSYQLENVGPLQLSHAIITYLSPNHLERYRDLEHYYNTKMKIFELAEGAKIVNQNGGDAESFLRGKNSSIILTSQRDPQVTKVVSLQSSKLLGAHNADNIAMALRCAQELKIDSIHFGAALAFRGLPHRLEYVGEIKGVHYVNDSKATALDSVLTATASVEAKLKDPSKMILLLGGRDKNLPWESLSALEKNAKIQILIFGEARERIAQVFPKSRKFARLGEAIEHAMSLAKENDYVLLSPGGTSMDEFANFEKRGEYFVSKVSSKSSNA